MLACALAFHGVTGAAATGERYPSRPIRLVVPFAPGGGADISARLIAQKLSERYGQQVVADNRPGAGGTVGTELVLKAAPDGYTLLLVSSSYGANPALYRLSFDPVTAFEPVTLVSQQPFVMAIHLGVPAKSVKEFIGYAKANPGKLNYLSSGTGGIQHLATELFKNMAAVNLVHIPYRGGSSGVNDLLAGQVHMVFGTVLSTMPMVRAGQLRALAVTTRTRSPGAPELPSLAEAGVPGYHVSGWYAVLAPKTTPRAVTAGLNREIVALLTTPEVKERYAKEGSIIAASTPAGLTAHIQSEVDKWRKLVREANIVLEATR
ncbi:MAG: tripartite tricarboxylate transporter substrate binding protein [Burkholderiales bacterium]|nr:tripartite tricarboxylate transporter substrate binding protein [Burkholderiales bacterium]